MIITKHLTPLLTLMLAGLLFACQQETIMVFVTPTPQALAASSTPVPTIQPSAAASATETDSPTGTAPLTATITPIGPTATFLGPIIGTDYALPATSTPQPTNSPPPDATQPPSPTDEPVQPAGPAPDRLPDLDPARMGIQLDPTLNREDWAKAVEDINRLGLRWLKVQVAWSLLQPNGPDEINDDFRRLETYLESAYNNGGGPSILISVAKAPAWARTTSQSEDGPPDDPQQLANFISLMLREFGQAVGAVEVWNEPNLQREWQGKLPFSGAGYMTLFRPSYEAIRAYSPTLTIITAGLAPTGNNPGSRDDREFMREMYTAGLSNYQDVAVGIHPYGWGNAPDATCCQMEPEPGWDDDPHFFFLDNLDDYREIMVSNGHENAQMWITEFGWASWDGFPNEPPEPWMKYTNECQQGIYTVRAFQMGQERDYIGPMMLWNLNFAILTGLVENRDERAAYSLIVPRQARERAAYWMLYDAMRPAESLSSYAACPGPG